MRRMSKLVALFGPGWRKAHGSALCLVLGAVAISSAAMGAEVYKWTDANGQVHFSDKPPPSNDKSAQQNVSQVRLTASGPSYNLRRLTPITDSGGASRVPLRLAALSQSVMASGKTDLTPGQQFTGVGCSEAAPLVLVAEEVNFEHPKFVAIASGAFADSGWSIGGPEATAAGMELRGDVSSLRVDRCFAP